MTKTAWTHDSANNKTVDWYTPPWIFERLSLGFDLDPCSPEGGVSWIPASSHYSLKDDGLAQPWAGRVWLNPPYGKHTAAWLAKMNKHRHGVALVFARTDTAWYHESVAKADAILFLRGRIKFIDAFGKTGGAGAGSGSMLIAWGGDCVKALQHMADAGHLVVSS